MNKSYKYILAIALFIIFSGTANAQHDEIPREATDISPLLIGEFIPEGNLQDISGNAVSLQEIISAKPAVIIFYRGGWCPYCNLHLAELQGIEKNILEMGYQIIGISPDSPEKLSMTKAFGLAFRAPDKYSGMLSERSGDKNPGLCRCRVFSWWEQTERSFLNM